MYAADAHFWRHHIHDINCGFGGKRWSCETPGKTNWGKKDITDWNINILNVDTQAKGLSRDADTVHSGGNSGYQAINLAYHLGATRIILLGFDMFCHGGRSHWFGDHPASFPNSKGNPARFIADFRTIKPEDYGIEIINCSRVTALDAFPVMALEELF